MKQLLLIALIQVLIMGVACSSGKTEQKKMPIKKYYLQEELTINTEPNDFYSIARPYYIVADEKGNIFVFDWQSLQVSIFDNQGRFLRVLGKKGIGPNEMLTCDTMAVDKESRIHLLDSKLRKIVRYRLDGVAEEDLRLPDVIPSYLWITPEGDYLVKQTLTSTSTADMVNLVKYNRNGQKIRTSRQFIGRISHHETVVGKDGNTAQITATTDFDPTGYFALDNKGNLYYGCSDTYQITLLTPSFSEIMFIRRDEVKRPPVSSTQKEEYMQWLKRKSEKRGFAIPRVKLPDYNQIFEAIWTDGNQRLMVLLHTPDQKQGFIIDIYDWRGNYLEKMFILPLTDGIDNTTVFESPFFQKNALYTIVQDKEGEYFIKRYKITPLNTEV